MIHTGASKLLEAHMARLRCGYHRGRLENYIAQCQEQGGADTEEKQCIQNFFHN